MDKSDPIVIDFPLRGEWQFLRPPGHHAYAFDFVQQDERGRYFQVGPRARLLLGGVKSSEYYCWDQPVYAPVYGEVIRVGVDWPDHQTCNIWKTILIWYNATYRFRPVEVDGRLDIRPNAGNHVMIRTKENFIVFLAHLKAGSVLPKEGQKVSAGDLLGSVGSSGNSTAPHLHINLFDQMEDPIKAKVLPFLFRKYEQLSNDGEWLTQDLNIPKVKSLIRLS